MGPGFDRKLAVLAALSALACTVAVGGLSFWASSRSLGDSLHKQARSSARQLALHASEELTSVIERSRFYISTSQSKAFEADGELLALTVLRKPAIASSDSEEWQPITRWRLPEEVPGRLSQADFEEIDLKYPVDTDRIALGQKDVIFAKSAGIPAFLRVAVPYGEKSASGYEQALVTEIKMSRFQALFAHREGIFAFMTAARGQLVIATDSSHFGPAEDLTQLDISRAAHDSTDSQGSLDYRETSQGETQYAAFARVAAAPGLTVFAQAPHSRIAAALDPLLTALAAAGLAFALSLGLVVWWFSSRWSWELRVPKPSDTAAAAAPPSASGSPQPFSKISDPALRQSFEQGHHKLTGERIEAAVLHAHLHGVDRLSAQANPERLLSLLNTFHQKAVRAVESRQGVVDHMHGGSVVAFWGVPSPLEGDVPHAIEAAAEISEAAHELNQTLKQENLALCRLGMGLHYGSIAVGSIGTSGRQEYSAVGEALEVAARIQQFTDQFGTDFLMTGAAAQRAGDSFATEQVTAGDDSTPELYELAGDEEAADEEEAA